MKINRYRVKILPQEGGFVGYLMNFDDLVFETNVLDSVDSCNSAINAFLKTATPIPLSAPKHSSSVPITAPRRASNNFHAPRHGCCGAG